MQRINFIPDQFYMGLSPDKEAFANELLKYLGLFPTENRMRVLRAWMDGEGTQAQNNPLATTWKLPGSTYFNCLKKDASGLCVAGVQNFVDSSQGIQATLKTINQTAPDYYYAIRDLLKRDTNKIYTNDLELKKAFDTWGTTYNLFQKMFIQNGGQVLTGTTTATTESGFSWKDLIKPVAVGVLSALILNQFQDEDK